MPARLTLDTIRSAVLATAVPETRGGPIEDRSTLPVVTISRQAGTDAEAVAARLADRLNGRATREPPWSYFDRRLVEEIAADHNLSEHLVETNDERDKAWYEEMIHGLSGDPAGGMAIKTATTVRRLARRGHVIIVGRGGQLILEDLANAVHVRLTAPEDWRTARHAESTGATPDAARSELRQIDSDRRRFVKAHFRRDITDPALFHLILNMGRVSPDQAAATIEPLVADL